MKERGVKMKINYTPQVIRSVKNYKKQISKTEAPKSRAMKPDKIEISASAKEVQRATAAYKKVPDIRESRVSELREKISKGEYNISSDKIAEAILGN